MSREILPQRRKSIRFKERSLGYVFEVTLGLYPDGRLGEVFLNSGKIGSDSDVLCRDMAIGASLALQFGCPLETLRDALTRDAQGKAESPLGIALDAFSLGATNSKKKTKQD